MPGTFSAIDGADSYQQEAGDVCHHILEHQLEPAIRLTEILGRQWCRGTTLLRPQS